MPDLQFARICKPLIVRGLAKIDLNRTTRPPKTFWAMKVKKKWTSIPRDLKVFEPYGFV